jgi:hypothetical protein
LIQKLNAEKQQQRAAEQQQEVHLNVDEVGDEDEGDEQERVGVLNASGLFAAMMHI